MSLRSQVQSPSFLAGNEGFERIPSMQKERSNDSVGSAPKDATIDIPLTQIATNKSGFRKQNSQNEKTSDGLELRKGGRRRPRKDLRGSDIEQVNKMGMIYRKILNSSIVVRYFLYIVPVGAILTVPIVVGSTVQPRPGIGFVSITWIFAWGLTMWVALWVSKLFAKLLPYIFEFLCGIVSPGIRKYSTIIKALEIPISLVLWAVASLATWMPIITNNPSEFTITSPNQKDIDDAKAYANNWIDIVQRVLAALLACSLVYLAEKAIIQLISVSYHRMQYDSNIRESKQSVTVLATLYEASTAQFPPFCDDFLQDDYLIHGTPNLMGSRGHHRSGSATPMRIIAHVNRIGDKITSAFGNIAHEVTGKEVFNPGSAHAIVVEALEKNSSSVALGKRIWQSFVQEGKESLGLDDMIEVLVDEPTAVAIEAFETLDTDHNGDITLDEMIMKVCEVGRQRKSIASSLHDVDQAINVLDNLLLAVVLLVCVFIIIAFLNTSFVTTLATAGTALLSLSFVFSVTAQEVLGSCIFLFVKHPFDVGDVVVVDTQQLVVERISLLYSVFKNTVTHTTTQCPNVVLNTKWIDNISRSKCMRESLLIDVSFDTTLEDVEFLRRELEAFVRDPDNSRDFEPDVEVELRGVGSMDRLQLGIDIKHKSNWSNRAVTAARRSKFMCALVLALRKVPIYAPGGGGAALGSADQPTYSVSVTNEQAAAARAAFDKAKAESHIKAWQPGPADKSSGDWGASTAVSDRTTDNLLTRQRSPPLAASSETNALASLNTRAPAQDSNHDWQTEDVPSIKIRQPSQAGQTLSPVGEERSSEVESAFALRRTSTHGKRRQSQASRSSQGSAMPAPRLDLPGMPGPNSPAYQQHSGPTLGKSQTFPMSQRADGLGTGQYNPYIQTAPIYEYPPGRISEEGSVRSSPPRAPLPRIPGSSHSESDRNA